MASILSKFQTALARENVQEGLTALFTQFSPEDLKIHLLTLKNILTNLNLLRIHCSNISKEE